MTVTCERFGCRNTFNPSPLTTRQNNVLDTFELLVCTTCANTCYNRCSNCDYLCNFDDLLDHGLCADCWNETYSYCEDCGDSFYREDLNRDLLCNGCVTSEDGCYLGDDGWDPCLTPKGKGKIHYGLEWEVECNGSMTAAYEHLKNVLPRHYSIIKDDSTIEFGFELCTRPATLHEHKKAWSRYWSEPNDHFNNELMSKTCGIHVHITRAPLSDLQIGKMLAFVQGRSNNRFIENLIAERHSMGYGDFKRRRKVSDVKGRYPERYDGLNICNKTTVELRLFRSTTNETRFWKNLEFAEALTHFTYNSVESYRKMHWREFQTFTKNNKKIWPNLHTMIDKYTERRRA